MQKTMKPAMILKTYFGSMEGQDNAGFIQEMRDLKEFGQDQEHFKELVILAAEELEITPDFG